MKIYSLAKVLFILISSAYVYCDRLLLLFPVPSSSHFILGSSLAKGLVEAGHDVTFLSPYVDKNPPKKGVYKHILLTQIHNYLNRKNIDLFSTNSSITKLHSIITELVSEVTVGTLNSTELNDLIKSNKKYDAVIVEEFLADSLKVVPYLFNAPLISFSSIGPNSGINSKFCNPSPLSYIPDTSLSLPEKMNFFERLQNVLFNVMGLLYNELSVIPTQKELLRKFFPDAPDFDRLKYNASLILLNSHISSSQAVPLVPGMIPIGGFHIQPPEPLPENVQYYLDGATEGAIYFSMGSILKSTNMPLEKVNIFLKTFEQLGIKVLWKWEDENLPGKSDNILIQKWFPQASVLAHPNVKLFITHGGLLSISETIYHGKPVLAIPIFGDQMSNAQRIVDGGFGISQKYSELSSVEQLLDKIKELLHNPRYSQNAKLKSRLFHDRPLKPMEEADFWIRHVVKFNGAPHLRVAGMDLRWYQYHLLDVFSFLIGSCILTIGVFILVIKNLCCRRKERKLKTT